MDPDLCSECQRPLLTIWTTESGSLHGSLEDLVPVRATSVCAFCDSLSLWPVAETSDRFLATVRDVLYGRGPGRLYPMP